MHPSLASGVTGAAPIWNDIMREALKDLPDEPPRKPDSVLGATVCADFGNQVSTTEGETASCPTRFEYLIKGFTNPNAKLERQLVSIDNATGQIAKEGPASPDGGQGGQTDNFEQREETILADPTGDRFCLSCPLPPEFFVTPTAPPGQVPSGPTASP